MRLFMKISILLLILIGLNLFFVKQQIREPFTDDFRKFVNPKYRYIKNQIEPIYNVGISKANKVLAFLGVY